ncbi:hypothetical protein ATANTOWER_000286 [Ataeniobius toweri]|uniref:Uncharacterized protein n=1 Tax=Ataeniobius toweri TaxID=208326 RepID=A0ABU7A3I6_9TELE|nr:hypothetical protein [Ataeniobius toweri]
MPISGTQTLLLIAAFPQDQSVISVETARRWRVGGVYSLRRRCSLSKSWQRGSLIDGSPGRNYRSGNEQKKPGGYHMSPAPVWRNTHVTAVRWAVGANVTVLEEIAKDSIFQ